MDHEDIEYISPDSQPVSRLMKRILEGEEGETGLKILPFVDSPGIVYNYRIRFEDGTGEVIREEVLPVFVDGKTHDPRRSLGKRIIDGDSIKGSPDPEKVRNLLENKDVLRDVTDRYVSQHVESTREKLRTRREEQIQQELDDLEEYAEAERERIEEFIEEYEKKSDAGSDMDIAIRGQRERLRKLEDRIENRRQELLRKEQVISLAPEVENSCLVFPV